MMTNVITSNRLELVKQLLYDPTKWAKGYYAYNVSYFNLPKSLRKQAYRSYGAEETGPQAKCWCLEGAYRKVKFNITGHESGNYYETVDDMFHKYLSQAITKYCKVTGIDLVKTVSHKQDYDVSIPTFNDHERVNWADVISVLDIAICIAKENND